MNTCNQDKHRKVAILRHVWSLTDEETSWLDSYFLLRATQTALDNYAVASDRQTCRIVYKGVVYDTVRLMTGYPENLLLSMRYSKQLQTAVAVIITAPNNISEKILAATSEFPE